MERRGDIKRTKFTVKFGKIVSGIDTEDNEEPVLYYLVSQRFRSDFCSQLMAPKYYYNYRSLWPGGKTTIVLCNKCNISTDTVCASCDPKKLI